jgi:hypothetical protein
MKRKDSKKKQIRTDVSALLAFLSAFIGAFLGVVLSAIPNIQAMHGWGVSLFIFIIAIIFSMVGMLALFRLAAAIDRGEKIQINWVWLLDLHPRLMNCFTLLGLALAVYSIRPISPDNVQWAAIWAIRLFVILAIFQLWLIVLDPSSPSKAIRKDRVRRRPKSIRRKSTS